MHIVLFCIHRQTTELEVYHGHYLMYAPKCIFFKYVAMKTRMQLSCIDHNHHVNLPAAVDDFGDNLITRRWSKAGEKDYSYIPFLLTSIMKARAEDKRNVSHPVPLAENDPQKIAKNIAKLPTPNSKKLNKDTIARVMKRRNHCAK